MPHAGLAMNLSSSNVPLSALATWCRALKQGIGAGLSPAKVLRMQARSGPASVRDIAADVSDRMEKGDSLSDALSVHRERFPPLFVELTGVGEESGHLEDVFDELALYYENAWRARQEFRRMMIYPLLQFGGAVMVITLLIFILGLLAGNDGSGVDVLGLGLTGTTGALTFLAIMAGISLAAFLAYRFLTQTVAHRAKLEAIALHIPAWGPALHAFALQRFALGLRISHEAGLSADRCVRFGFRATANNAFLDLENRIAAKVKKGQEIAPVLARSGAPFPEEFLASLTLAESTGQITEVMGRVAENYREQGMRKLGLAVQFTGYGIYAGVAILIIIAIFRIASIYIGAINSMM